VTFFVVGLAHDVPELLEDPLVGVDQTLERFAPGAARAGRWSATGVVLGLVDQPVDLLRGEAAGGVDLDALRWLVAMSRAETLTMPFESMANVTSIWGTPRGAGGMPTSSKRPSERFSAAISRSPWSTWISTVSWLSRRW
jgi:hypothetical protein